ncbi:MAG: putative glycoside hydrolase [Anaerolineae bacterium]
MRRRAAGRVAVGAAVTAAALAVHAALAQALPPSPIARIAAADDPTPRPIHLPIALDGARPAGSVPTARPPTPWPPTATPTAFASPSPPPGPSPSPTAVPTSPAGPARPWPDTADGIHVFNDQLVGLGNLSDAQIRFAATHYAGTQKMTRPDADRLRAIDPNFLILHYRLGTGLGYRVAEPGCAPTGGYIQIVDGSRWVQEWPGDDAVRAPWFFPWAGAPRVYFCDFGWYLMDTANDDYRAWWTGEVLRQLAANDDDALFADSVSVPSFFGADHWRPALPVVDAAFEADWSRRIDGWLAYVKGRFGASYLLLPNAGSWVTTRDRTRYAAADGVMIEGFASWAPGRRFDIGDWRLQMDRVLGLTTRGKIIIAQSYPTGDGSPSDADDRMFLLANYLLVKGHRSYLNLETSSYVDWWPEYEIALGRYVDEPPARVDALLERMDGVSPGLYVRRYERGMAVVNPSDQPVPLDLGRTMWSARPEGGGVVPADGRTDGWRVGYTSVERIDVGAGRAEVLLYAEP